MRSYLYTLLILVLTLTGCGKAVRQNSNSNSAFRYSRNITVSRNDGYATVRLSNPWKQGQILHTYILVNHKDSARLAGHLPQGTVVYVPLRRAVVFTAAHTNLMEMLHAGNELAGVADPQYIHIDDVRKRIANGSVVSVGNSMKPDYERIISVGADAVLLSPFENSGGYGRLDKTGIPIIECAEYMESSALGRAEWMKFYGMLFGREHEADSLFAEVERNYNRIKKSTSDKKSTLSILPERKTGSVWYVPGGKSTMGMLYKDAGISYALGNDSRSGSVALPFETVLDKFGNADIWIFSYNGTMNRHKLLSEYRGYSELKAFKNGNIYGCAVDTTPYFEEVSWRPDWLLNDLVRIFHHQSSDDGLKYYHKIK